MEQKIIRSFFFPITAEKRAEGEEEYVIEGRPIVYDSVTDIGYFRETIAKGALDNTDLKDVPLLINHDDNGLPLARSRNNNANSSMQLLVDDEGMLIRTKLDVEKNPQAQALYSSVLRGDIDGMSFAFSIADEEWTGLDTEAPLRTVKEISKVYEVSCVTWPAYKSTSVEARNDAQALESAREALESAKQAEAHKEKLSKLSETLDKFDGKE